MDASVHIHRRQNVAKFYLEIWEFYLNWKSSYFEYYFTATGNINKDFSKSG